jgi:predicted Zn-dependent protease with MMP-like domain
MDRSTFVKLVNEALERLPKRFRDKLHNVVVDVENEPSPELLEDMGIESGTLFGLYQGVPLTEREWNYGNVLPDRIVIYQRPIERVAATPEQIEDVIMDTVEHEIGHYFGFDDAALYEIEDEKMRRKNGRKGKR